MNKKVSTKSNCSTTARKSKQTSNTTTAASSKQKSRILRCPANTRIAQNVVLIWLDANIDDYRNTITQLRRVIISVNTFIDTDSCLDFLANINNEKVFMIISSTLSQRVLPLIHNITQLDSIYIFDRNLSTRKHWTQQWSKIKGIFTETVPICEALQQAAQRCEQNAISISFMPIIDNKSDKNLDQLDQSFMYTQILKEILLTINFDEQHIKDYVNYSREQFVRNDHQLNMIDKLERDYRHHSPIWWYTYECFMYSMLNRALRIMDIEIIVKMGFFIQDLHRHIERLHLEQFGSTYRSQSFVVYRGQGLSKLDFDKLLKTKGGLLAFNNFLSTSKDRDVSFAFAQSNQDNPDLIGVLFVMNIDPSKPHAPCASISDVSYYKDAEDEVLFSMNTIFRIDDIKSMSDNKCLWQVELTLTSDDDRELRALTEHMQKETKELSGWHRLGDLLIKLGQSDKAQHIYKVMLEQIHDDHDKANIYHQIGRIKDHQAKYGEAITWYEKSLEIRQTILSPNHPDMASSYNNIAIVYQNTGDYTQALSSHEKALEIRQNIRPPNYSDLANSYGNIGILYHDMGEYEKALSFYKKDLEISQKILPPNHPHLANSHDNIAVVYANMGDYSNALSSHEKALNIRQRSLPSDHPNVAASYNNIGLVYKNMGEYSKALSSHEKALEIRQKTLLPNHPDLAMSYGNIGLVYKHIGEYSKALAFYEQALEIKQKTLLPNHPDLAGSYNNIGMVYLDMGDWSNALSSHQKALDIREKSLPSNHPDVAASYNNIGLVYNNTNEYSKALSFHEKAFEIRQKIFPPNHPDMAYSHSNLGRVYYHNGEYQQALSSYEKSLEIRQKTLSSKHPDLAASYDHIGSTYYMMGDYSKAFQFYQQAVDTAQRSLPTNHPHLHVYTTNLEIAKQKL